jgi:hypothetical protein
MRLFDPNPAPDAQLLLEEARRRLNILPRERAIALTN